MVYLNVELCLGCDVSANLNKIQFRVVVQYVTFKLHPRVSLHSSTCDNLLAKLHKNSLTLLAIFDGWSERNCGKTIIVRILVFTGYY